MKKLFAILLFSFLSLTATRSQTVDGILDKYFENIGGIEKCKAIKTMKMTGQIPTPQGEFTFEMSRKAPNKTIVTVDVMGQKIIPQAFDGTVAWMINPFTGNSDAQIMPEEQAKSMKLDAVLEDPFIDYTVKGHEVTYEGTGDVEGTPVHILKMVRNKGKADEALSTTYFDSNSYLPVMQKQKIYNEQAGDQEVEIYMSDYQDIGEGLMMPFNMDTRMNSQSVQAIKFTTITINQEIPDSLFTFPGTVPAVQ
jgi:outer membrane lipoprotein-sorting protein